MRKQMEETKREHKMLHEKASELRRTFCGLLKHHNFTQNHDNSNEKKSVYCFFQGWHSCLHKTNSDTLWNEIVSWSQTNLSTKECRLFIQ